MFLFSEKNVLIVNQDKICVGFVAIGKAFVLEEECEKALAVSFVKVKKHLYEKYKSCLQDKGVILLSKEDFGLEEGV